MCAARSMSAISLLRRLVRIAPNAATPTAPPSERKKETPVVVEAMSRSSEPFCAARMSICIDRPSPMPSTPTSNPMSH